MIKKTLYTIILSLLVAVNFSAQTAGNSGLSFLKFGFGARNIAMGDAGTAASKDITSLFYNPARLAGMKNSEAIFMHNEWIEDVSSEVVGIRSFVLGIPIALGFNVTSVGDIEVRTNPGEPETKFDANYFYGSLSTGFEVYHNISVGASIKYLYEGLLSDEATGFGFDLAALYKTDYDGLIVSAALRNIGSMNELRSESTKLPAEIRIGPAYNFNLEGINSEVTLVTEFQKFLNSDDNHFNIGAEIFYDNLIAIRGGYQTGYESRDLTFGIGLAWGNLNFDYAFLPFQLGLGSANLFSLQFKF